MPSSKETRQRIWLPMIREISPRFASYFLATQRKLDELLRFRSPRIKTCAMLAGYSIWMRDDDYFISALCNIAESEPNTDVSVTAINMLSLLLSRTGHCNAQRSVARVLLNSTQREVADRNHLYRILLAIRSTSIDMWDVFEPDVDAEIKAELEGQEVLPIEIDWKMVESIASSC